jgi:glycosyltransferase involved in cell wall biosynthesis
MKICLIANPNSPHTHRWIRNFVELGHELYLIGEHPVRRNVPVNCVFFDLTARFNIRKLRYIFWKLEIRRLIRQIQPTVLHAHGVTSAGWLGAASGFHPFLVTSHGSDLLLLEQRSRLHQLLSLWALRQADRVICVSQELANKAATLGINKDLIEVVYLGTDTRVFYPRKNTSALRSKLGLLHDPLVLSIRPITPLYRPLDLANAIPLVLERFPTTCFAIFTHNHDPTTLSLFKKAIQNNHISHAIKYIGELPNDSVIADHYRTADISISIAESDGTPISVLEAMSCGSALIVSDLATLHYWIQNEQEALVVPVGDVNAIANAIIRLLSDPDLRYQLGKNAVKVIRERGDSQYWTKCSLEIYQKLIMEISRKKKQGRYDF